MAIHPMCPNQALPRHSPRRPLNRMVITALARKNCGLAIEVVR